MRSLWTAQMGFKSDSGVLIGHIEEKHTGRKGDCEDGVRD